MYVDERGYPPSRSTFLLAQDDRDWEKPLTGHPKATWPATCRACPIRWPSPATKSAQRHPWNLAHRKTSPPSSQDQRDPPPAKQDTQSQ